MNQTSPKVSGSHIFIEPTIFFLYLFSYFILWLPIPSMFSRVLTTTWAHVIKKMESNIICPTLRFILASKWGQQPKIGQCSLYLTNLSWVNGPPKVYIVSPMG